MCALHIFDELIEVLMMPDNVHTTGIRSSGAIDVQAESQNVDEIQQD